MAATFAFSFDLPVLGCVEQLPPNPTLLGELGVTTAALALTLGGNPGQPCVHNAAPWALWNPAGSGYKATLTDLRLGELQSRTTTATLNRCSVVRTTAMAGGVAVPIARLDTSSASLPAAVTCATRPNVTTTAATVRELKDAPQLNATRVIALPPWCAPGCAKTWDVRGTEPQGLVLREGQGLAVGVQTASKEPYPRAITILFSVSGATYQAQAVVWTGIPVPLGLFNGPGSGVVLTVHQVIVEEVATDETNVQRFQLEPISGLRDGVAVTVTPLDSIETWPTALRCVERAGCQQVSADVASPPARTCESVYRRLARAPFGASPGVANRFLFPEVVGQVLGCGKPGVGVDALVLRPGEGIALYQRQTTSGRSTGYHLSGVILVESVAGQAIVPPIGGGLVRAA